MPSAAERAVSIPELLLGILSELDMRTLLLSQRVSKQWQALIVSTPALQRALFFEPIAAARTPAQLVTERQRNPLLEAVFPLFFLKNVRFKGTNKNHVPAAYMRMGDKPFAFMDDDQGERGSSSSKKQKEKPRQRKEAFLRKGASWRRMLVQQPPAPKLGLIEMTRLHDCNNAWFTEPGGALRMGALYDLVWQFMGNQKAESSNRHAFGVYWREPKYDPAPNGYGQEPNGLADLEGDVVVVVLRDAGDLDWSMDGRTDPALVRKAYRPSGWKGRKVEMKRVATHDWFG